eukprot:5336495-Lingulodinium_polyedra.AAC.1
MDSPRTKKVHGQSVANPWPVHGLYMDWPMDWQWIGRGRSMDCTWPVHGLSMDNRWAIHGMPMA